MKRRRLRGAAADAAMRLLPPQTQRTVYLMAELCEVPLRRAVRILIHDYKGNVDEFRTAAIYDVVRSARGNKTAKWPNKLISGMSDAEIAERVVGDRLISERRQFPAYLADVHFALTGQEKP